MFSQELETQTNKTDDMYIVAFKKKRMLELSDSNIQMGNAHWVAINFILACLQRTKSTMAPTDSPIDGSQ